jgi:hypothetical protein
LDRITFNEEHDKSKVLPSMLFILVILIYLFFRFVVDDYARSGEMWAEMATGYYNNAKYGDLYHQFFATDAGYIPLLQRILAWSVNILKVSVDLIPYLYAWLSIFISAILVGTFTLHYFRPLVQNDFTRMLISLILLITMSWETANFISFTYLNLFYISIFVALALSKHNDDAPAIAFIIPILIMSKVHVLSIIPMMFLSMFFVKQKYKYIFGTTIFMATLQVVQTLVSHMNGGFVSGNNFSFFEKIFSAISYSLIYIGNNFVGYGNHLASNSLLKIGIIIVIFALFTLYIKRKNSNILIVIGLSIMFFTYFINSFALSYLFNMNPYYVNHSMMRWVFPGFMGSLLLLTGILESWGHIMKYKPLIKYFSFTLILMWIIFGSLIKKGINNSGSPTLVFSNWQTMARSIEVNDDNSCVPIDPYGWMYSRNCKYLSKINFSIGAYKKIIETTLTTSIDIPTEIQNKKIISLLVGVNTTNNTSGNVELHAIATTISGRKVDFFGFKNNVSNTSMVLLNNSSKEAVAEIIKLEITSNIPLKYWVNNGNTKPSISWMGH